MQSYCFGLHNGNVAYALVMISIVIVKHVNRIAIALLNISNSPVKYFCFASEGELINGGVIVLYTIENNLHERCAYFLLSPRKERKT
mgnify:FL=1